MVFLDQNGRVRLQISFQDGIHIAWRHAYTVKIVPTKVSHYQIDGNLIGLLGSAAALFNKSSYPGWQRIAGNNLSHVSESI